MVYSEFLKQENVMKALKDAGVSDVESIIDTNFVFDHKDKNLVEYAIDQEILSRRRRTQSLKEYEDRIKEQRNGWWKSPKAEKLRPHIEQALKGRVKNTDEEFFINYLSKTAADSFEFTDEDQAPAPTGKTELERLLQGASVRLSVKPTPSDIAQRLVRDPQWSHWIKE